MPSAFLRSTSPVGSQSPSVACALNRALAVSRNDAEASVISLLRKGASHDDLLFVVCNFTPVPRTNYRIGVPRGGFWQEVLNSDATLYGGSGWGNLGGIEAVPVPLHGRSHSLTVTLPPLATN